LGSTIACRAPRASARTPRSQAAGGSGSRHPVASWRPAGKRIPHARLRPAPRFRARGLGRALAGLDLATDSQERRLSAFGARVRTRAPRRTTAAATGSTLFRARSRWRRSPADNRAGPARVPRRRRAVRCRISAQPRSDARRARGVACAGRRRIHVRASAPAQRVARTLPARHRVPRLVRELVRDREVIQSPQPRRSPVLGIERSQPELPALGQATTRRRRQLGKKRRTKSAARGCASCAGSATVRARRRAEGRWPRRPSAHGTPGAHGNAHNTDAMFASTEKVVSLTNKSVRRSPQRTGGDHAQASPSHAS
jgi:hypothetical protein